MKFLCVDCDEAMHLEGTRGPDHGSMTVIFACPKCSRRTAMLTNTMETQVVRSLGVKIGGRTVAAEPMEMVRGSLVGSRSAEAYSMAPLTAPHEPDSAVPDDSENRSVEETVTTPSGATHAQPTSKCPFTGMVNEAFAERASVRWTDGARRRMDRIPEFARGMVMKGVEDSARAQGLEEVTESVLDEVRGQFGM